MSTSNLILPITKPKKYRTLSPLAKVSGERNFAQGRRIGLIHQLVRLIHQNISDDRERSQLLGMLNTISLKIEKVIDTEWNTQKAVIKSTATETKIPS